MDPWIFEESPIYNDSWYGKNATLNQEDPENKKTVNKQNLQDIYYHRVYCCLHVYGNKLVVFAF